MLPPPLTDEEVRQRILSWWEGEYVRLGISYDAEGVPENSATLETWLEITPAIYRREWEKAYRYGLADDALTNILTKLEAPANAQVQLAKVLAKEDMAHLFRTLSEMCDTDEVYAWGLIQGDPPMKQYPWWILVPFAASVVCIVLATVTSEPLWAIGWIFCCVLGIVGSRRVADHSLRRRFEQQVDPQMTFFQLAENIRDTAKNRAREMLEAAEKPLAFR